VVGEDKVGEGKGEEGSDGAEKGLDDEVANGALGVALGVLDCRLRKANKIFFR
jgi:hypothetical protein